MKRPAIVTVFGVLNLVFGGLGLCGTVFTAGTMALLPEEAARGNPVFELMHEHAGYAAFMKISVALGLVATIVLIAAGIGLLQLKPWGRTASIGYALYGIAAALAGAVVNYLVLVGPMLEKAQALPPGPERAGMTGGAIGGMAGSCFGLIYPVILLIFMFTPTVKEAFRRRARPYGKI